MVEKRTKEAKEVRPFGGDVHSCDEKVVEVHGHLQCSVCGRVVEACCEGGSSHNHKCFGTKI